MYGPNNKIKNDPENHVFALMDTEGGPFGPNQETFSRYKFCNRQDTNQTP